MASILDLSAELKLGIIEHLDQTFSRPTDTYITTPPPDLSSLSQACSIFRELCIPVLLRDVTLVNTPKSGDYILSVTNSTRAKHVRNVHYICIKALPATAWHGEDNAIPPSLDDFPDSVSRVLSNLGRLPNLERVVVQFVCAREVSKDEENIGSSLEMFDHLDAEASPLEAEKTDAHRSLMAQSYHALTLNPPSSIRHLELKDVAALVCSTWNDSEFQALLQNLSSFSISLRDSGSGKKDWCINTRPGYREFISNLPLYFFNHVTQVEHFSFAATSEGPPGLDQAGYNCPLLPLLGTHMPLLQTLTVKDVFINTELADFIVAHASTLESVQLMHCYSAYMEDLTEQVGIHWAELFSRIAAAPMHALRRFDVGQADFEKDPPFDKDDMDYTDLMNAHALREKVPGRRMLDYKTLDDKYGFLFMNLEAGYERFENGEDDRQWQKLQELIKRNVEGN